VGGPASHIEPKPVQKPRPPVLLGGYSDATLERVGRRADGWLAVGFPVPRLREMWKKSHTALEAGHDPAAAGDGRTSETRC